MSSWSGDHVIDAQTRCRTPLFSQDCSNITGWGPHCQYDHLLYDRTVVLSSLVEDFKLVCDRTYLRTVVNITYMLGRVQEKVMTESNCWSGLLVGAYLIGWMSDRFGRIPALSLGVLLVSISGFAGAHCYGPTGLILFSVLRFITGVGGMACFMVSFVLILEQVGPSQAVLVGIGEAGVIVRQSRPSRGLLRDCTTSRTFG